MTGTNVVLRMRRDRLVFEKFTHPSVILNVHLIRYPVPMGHDSDPRTLEKETG